MLMKANRLPVQRLAALDLALCYRFNRVGVSAPIRTFFSVISWLGNGKVWYALMLLLPVFGGREGLYVSLQMALTGVIGVIVYKAIKQLTLRPRPYMAHDSITAWAAPLDQFSFPSGHTLHAVGFSVVICATFPFMAWLLLPLALLMAASRMLLGLHYPTDVLLGAALGLVLSSCVLLALPLP
jgi:undecaprenyl-diphosphatase